MRRLPPLNALRSFEAAGRHLNLGRAAGELSVTHGAVSKQIKTLEGMLGKRLMKRSRDGISLTPEGRALLPRVTQALDFIASAAHDLDAGSIGGNVRISCISSFATHWLIPRFDRFRARHPEIGLTVHSAGDTDSIYDPETDIAIRFGRPAWPDRRVQLLTPMEFFPVCSPALLNGPNKILRPADLAHHVLLNDPDRTHWRDWFAKFGMTDEIAPRDLLFSDFNHIIAAARAGLGIAMGDNLTAHMDLRRGTLVRPLHQSLRSSSKAYYMLLPPDGVISKAAQTVVDWIMMEASASDSHG
jgi:LysR family glycine cleavage system transcriptional activator